MGKLKITLKKSTIGKIQKHKDTVKALGLKKIGDTVVKEDNNAIRGMVRAISFMLDVEEEN